MCSSLFGFAVGSCNALDHIEKILTSAEAINSDGSSSDYSEDRTPKDSIREFLPAKVDHMVDFYGWELLSHSFGGCFEDKSYACTELHQVKGVRGLGYGLGMDGDDRGWRN